MSNNCVVTSLKDNTNSLTIGAESTEEGDVGAFKHTFVMLVHDTEDVLRLTSEGSIVHLHFVGRNQDKVCGNVGAVIDLDNITVNESG